jgi:AcrR family transcriptional regulator
MYRLSTGGAARWARPPRPVSAISIANTKDMGLETLRQVLYLVITMNKQKTPVPRGRRREFDRSAALEKALFLFWRFGYEGVSIADLTRAIGIAPPSLYAAFGDKAALYREVLALYSSWADVSIKEFQRPGPIRDLIEGLLRKTADAATDSKFPPGCLVTTGLLHTAPEHRPLAKKVADMRATRARAIADRLQKAVDEGDLPKTVNARSMADYVSAISQGIMLQARDGASRSELHAMVDVAMKALSSDL